MVAHRWRQGGGGSRRARLLAPEDIRVRAPGPPLPRPSGDPVPAERALLGRVQRQRTSHASARADPTAPHDRLPPRAAAGPDEAADVSAADLDGSRADTVDAAAAREAPAARVREVDDPDLSPVDLDVESPSAGHSRAAVAVADLHELRSWD